MEFVTAIRALQNGHKVRRNIWPYDVTIATGAQGIIQSLIDGQPGPEPALWSPRITDLTAVDWEIHVPGLRESNARASGAATG